MIRDGVSGREYDITLKQPFERKDFIDAVQKALDVQTLQGQIFSVVGKHLNLENDEEFNKQKGNIIDGVIIFKIQRIPRGTNVNPSTLLDIILLELPTDLKKLPQIQEECPVCMDSSDHIKICHDKMCVQCFTMRIKTQNIKVKCSICSATVSPSQVFSQQLVRLLQSYHDLVKLLQNIDCQMCRCGFLCYNDSLRPRSDCPKCRRRFCFFCNRDWNDSMNNDSKFTCKNQCIYDNVTSFNLIDFKHGGIDENGTYRLKIPNQRICPKCLNLGGYGDKCKYHTCEKCDSSYKFCFYCLESVADCLRKNHPGLTEPQASSQKCMEPKIQDHSIFPRLMS